jgi:diacylglycerol kinase (ATP)
MKEDRFSIYDRIRSFGYAANGIFLFIKKEHNAWLHLLATIFVIALGFFKDISAGEWVAIVFAIGLVWVSEMFNTCLEKLIDFLSPGQDKRIKFIKDVAAGAVLVAALVALSIGLIIFIPYFF